MNCERAAYEAVCVCVSEEQGDRNQPFILKHVFNVSLHIEPLNVLSTIEEPERTFLQRLFIIKKARNALC